MAADAAAAADPAETRPVAQRQEGEPELGSAAAAPEDAPSEPDAGQQREALRQRDDVLLGSRRIQCKDGKPVRKARGARCRPVASAIAMFLPVGELEFVNHVFGKRHVLAYFHERATDCDVERALCAVSGDLIGFSPQMRFGSVLFPWVENEQDPED